MGRTTLKSSKHSTFSCRDVLLRTFAVSWHGFTTPQTFKDHKPMFKAVGFPYSPQLAKQSGMDMDKKVIECHYLK